MRLWGAGLAAVLLLGACTSEPSPREPSATSSETATPTPTVVAPTMSKQAGEDSPEGAAAFVQHYIDVFNYAAATGDVDGLSRLSSPDCKGCQSYITLYRDTYAAGGYFKGGEWKADQLRLSLLDESTVVYVRIKYGQSRYARTEGGEERSGAAGQSAISYYVSGPAKTRQIEKFVRTANP